MRAADAPVSGPARPVAVLVGFMGAGKSTVGKILADLLGVDFIDTDAEIVRRTGQTIPEIFDASGPDGFREIERDVVVDVLERHRGVVALGGGSVTIAEVAQALDGHRVVHLRVSPDAGFARVSGTERPLLATPNPDERYRELLAARTAVYSAVATIEIDTDTGDPHEVADAIVTEIAHELVPERTP